VKRRERAPGEKGDRNERAVLEREAKALGKAFRGGIIHTEVKSPRRVRCHHRQKKFIKLRQQIEQNRGGQQPQRQTSETKKGGEDDVRRVAQSEGKHGQGRGGRGVRGAGKGGNQRAES